MPLVESNRSKSAAVVREQPAGSNPCRIAAMPEDVPVYAPLSGENRSSDAPDSNSNAAPDDEQSDESTVSDQESKKQQRRYYWTMALLNLLETGAAAGVSKFTPLFLAARGLDVAQVGVVQCITQIVAARPATAES